MIDRTTLALDIQRIVCGRWRNSFAIDNVVNDISGFFNDRILFRVDRQLERFAVARYFLSQLPQVSGPPQRTAKFFVSASVSVSSFASLAADI